MALHNYNALLEVITPLRQCKRFRGKINIRKPKPPHFDRAVYLAITKPLYPPKKSILPPSQLCNKIDNKWSKDKDVNPYQQIIAKEIREHFYTSRLVGFFHKNSIPAEDLFRAKIQCKKEGMNFSIFGKKTLEAAVTGTPYETVLDFYVSHNLIIFSKEPNLKNMIKVQRKFPHLILMAALYDGKLINKDEILQYSNIPNLQAAQAGLVQVLQGVGGNIVTQLNSHQTTLVSHLESRMKELDVKKE